MTPRARKASPHATPRTRGFTLLEVLIALAILGMGLTVIMTSQAGAIADAKRGHNLTLATQAGRCKMTELEALVAKDGFQELDVAESGPCCADESGPMTCAWRVDKPTLAEPKYGDLQLDAELGSGQFGALGTLAQGEKTGSFGVDGGTAGVAEALAGANGAAPEGAAAAAGGMLGTVMQMVYPDLKAILEASSRKVTVEVQWTEGTLARTYELVQWVTIPKMALPPDQLPDDPADASGSAASGSAASTGSGRGGAFGPNRTPGAAR